MTLTTQAAPDRLALRAASAGLRVLATACWPESPADRVPPPIPGFVISTFSPLTATTASRCLTRTTPAPAASAADPAAAVPAAPAARRPPAGDPAAEMRAAGAAGDLRAGGAALAPAASAVGVGVPAAPSRPPAADPAAAVPAAGRPGVSDVLGGGHAGVRVRTGVVVVSAFGDLAGAVHVAGVVDGGGRPGPLMFFQAVPNAVAGHVAARWGLDGPVVCVGDADAGVDVAGVLIEDGDADQVLVVRVEQGPDRAEAVLLAGGPDREEGEQA